ncbi:hypothetical protein MD484_g8922, partial [Candolleomyces efflorescens]
MTKEILDQAASWSLKALTSPTPPTVPIFLAIIWREDSEKDEGIYITRIPGRKLGQFHPRELDLFPSVLIPRCHFQPVWSPLITCFKNDDPDIPVFIKQPRLVGYNKTAGLAGRVQQEISVLEALNRNPHPNIAQYLGCLVDETRGLIAGICIKRYSCTLAALLGGGVVLPDGTQQPPFNFDLILDGINAGIKHLHSMGLSHNDITPSNIMLDENGCAVIIDFNNSGAFGSACRPGTPGWTNFSRESAAENDLYGYMCIQQYMHTQMMQLAHPHPPAQAATTNVGSGFDNLSIPGFSIQPTPSQTLSPQPSPIVPLGYQWSVGSAP